MGIMINKEDDLNEDLTRRIDADLREKMKQASKMENPDFMDTEEYGEDLFKNIKI